MKVINILVNEHAIIKEFLSVLSTGVKKIIANENPPREFFEKAMTFSRDYADTHHHFKEEYIMFKLLANKKEGAIDGEISKLRKQHENYRDYLSEVSAALTGYENKLNEPTRLVHRNLSEYIQSLRDHIEMEEKHFYPMAQKTISVEEQEALLQEFDKYEEKAGEGFNEKYKSLVKEMSELIKS